eukprot:15440967-Alexandrium_andersonii.AAC.1
MAESVVYKKALRLIADASPEDAEAGEAPKKKARKAGKAKAKASASGKFNSTSFMPDLPKICVVGRAPFWLEDVCIMMDDMFERTNCSDM